MKIVLYKGDEFISDGYNRKDLSLPPDKLAKGLQYYFVHEIKPDNTNPDRYYLKPKEIVLTSEKHAKYDHFLKAINEFELTEYNQSAIIQKLNTSMGNYLDSEYMPQLRVKHTDELNLFNPDQDRIDYIMSLKNWERSVRLERDRREDEYLNNNIFPDLHSWDPKPV